MVDVDVSVEMAGVTLRNPVVVGTCDLTRDLHAIEKCIKAGVGAVVAKGVSYKAGQVRIRPTHFALNKFGYGFRDNIWLTAEAYHTMNPEKWFREIVPSAVKICHDAGVPLIANAIGETPEENAYFGRLAEEAGADMLEVPVASCPALPHISDTKAIHDLIQVTAEAVSIPIISKPPVWMDNGVEMCTASEKGGAKGISCCWWPSGILVDVDREEFWGLPAPVGLSYGRTTKPESLLRNYEIIEKVKIPVISGGGIWNGADAVEYLLIGSSSVEVASAVYFRGLSAWTKIVDEIKQFMIGKGYSQIKDFQGKLQGKLVQVWDIPTEKHFTLPSPITPVIDEKKCIFCTICPTSCIYDALVRDQEQKKIIVRKENCYGCGLCVTVCPTAAVKLVDTNGQVYWDGRGTAKTYQ